MTWYDGAVRHDPTTPRPHDPVALGDEVVADVLADFTVGTLPVDVEGLTREQARAARTAHRSRFRRAASPVEAGPERWSDPAESRRTGWPSGPGWPSSPGVPGALDRAGASERPGAAGWPGASEGPGAAGWPGASEGPGAAGWPGASEGPGAAGWPGTSGRAVTDEWSGTSPSAGAPRGPDEPVAAPTPSSGRRRARPRRRAGIPRWRVSPSTAVAAVVVLALLGGGVALRAGPGATGPAVAVEEPLASGPAASGSEDAPDPGGAASDGDPDADRVWVHVVGQVLNPGVVALPAGARVADAVEAAGGVLPGADVAALNLAAVVPDGAQVRVLAPGEEPPVDAALVTTGVDATGGAPAGGPASGSGTVDVNRASAADLQTLPGIGPVLADRIVAWRTDHGPFPSVESLRDVSGIGPALLSRLADLVHV